MGYNKAGKTWVGHRGRMRVSSEDSRSVSVTTATGPLLCRALALIPDSEAQGYFSDTEGAFVAAPRVRLLQNAMPQFRMVRPALSVVQGNLAIPYEDSRLRVTTR